MDNNILYSIVVPIYKVEKYLCRCIESIVDQTYNNIEVILVDDGSPDSCPEICEKYASIDERIVVIHKDNGGLVSARQAGARVSKGDYILCIDGDDWVDKTYVAEFNEVISDYGCDMVCCNAYEAYPEKKIEKRTEFKNGLYIKKDIEKYIFPYAIEGENCKYFPPSMWAKAIKRDLYMQEQMAVPTDITIGEDGACIKPILYKAQTIYLLDKFLYYYRINPESMTKVKKRYEWNDPIVLVNHLRSRIVSTKEIEEQYNRLLTIWAFKTSLSLFQTGLDYDSAKKNIKKNLSIEPYRSAAKKCTFKGAVGKTVKLMVSRKLTVCFYILSKYL